MTLLVLKPCDAAFDSYRDAAMDHAHNAQSSINDGPKAESRPGGGGCEEGETIGDHEMLERKQDEEAEEEKDTCTNDEEEGERENHGEEESEEEGGTREDEEDEDDDEGEDHGEEERDEEGAAPEEVSGMTEQDEVVNDVDKEKVHEEAEEGEHSGRTRGPEGEEHGSLGNIETDFSSTSLMVPTREECRAEKGGHGGDVSKVEEKTRQDPVDSVETGEQRGAGEDEEEKKKRKEEEEAKKKEMFRKLKEETMKLQASVGFNESSAAPPSYRRTHDGIRRSNQPKLIALPSQRALSGSDDFSITPALGDVEDPPRFAPSEGASPANVLSKLRAGPSAVFGKSGSVSSSVDKGTSKEERERRAEIEARAAALTRGFRNQTQTNAISISKPSPKVALSMGSPLRTPKAGAKKEENMLGKEPAAKSEQKGGAAPAAKAKAEKPAAKAGEAGMEKSAAAKEKVKVKKAEGSDKAAKTGKAKAEGKEKGETKAKPKGEAKEKPASSAKPKAAVKEKAASSGKSKESGRDAGAGNHGKCDPKSPKDGPARGGLGGMLKGLFHK